MFIAGLANYYIPSSKIAEVQKEVLALFDTNIKVENAKEKIASILNKYHSPSGKKTLDNE